MTLKELRELFYNGDDDREVMGLAQLSNVIEIIVK